MQSLDFPADAPDRDGDDTPSDEERRATFLTYEPFYGLREKPFSLSSHPRFLYRSPAHVEALQRLEAGIRRREGLIVLTGEIGTGKTTLCRAVIERLDRRTFSTFVPDPFLTREELLKTLLVGFGVMSPADLQNGRLASASRQDLSFPLYEFLDSLVPLQAFAVLVIDEAQNLSPLVLDEIRILAELEKRHKLIQVVLVGQPELRATLKRPDLRQVEQRVSVRCELTPLDAPGVERYIAHRLAIAAAPGEAAPAFSSAAAAMVAEASGGVPRLVNRICDRTLHMAWMGRTPSIGAEAVRAALVDLDMEVPAPMLEESPCAPSPEPTSAPGPPQLPTLSDAPAAALETAAPVSAVASEEAEAHQGIPLTHADGAVETPRHVTGPIRRPGGTAPTGRVWGTPAATDPLTEFANETASGETLAPAAVLPPTPPSVARRVALAVTAVAMLVLVALLVGALDINPNVDSTGEHSAGSLPHAPASPYDASVSVHGIVVPDEFQASLTDARTRAAGAYLIRAGVRTSRSAADALRSALAGTGLRAGLRQTASTSVERETSNGETYEVIVEGSGTLEDAMAVATRLRLQPGGEGAVVAGMPGAFASSTAAAAR